VRSLKLCMRCGEWKPKYRYFYKDKSKPDGRMYACIACTLKRREQAERMGLNKLAAAKRSAA
jgi:hypothetical protein